MHVCVRARSCSIFTSISSLFEFVQSFKKYSQVNIWTSDAQTKWSRHEICILHQSSFFNSLHHFVSRNTNSKLFSQLICWSMCKQCEILHSKSLRVFSFLRSPQDPQQFRAAVASQIILAISYESHICMLGFKIS